MKSYQNANYYKAWRTFYPEGNGHCKPGYVLHHKDPELRHKDIDRYLEWRPEDLVMMTKSDHTKLHMTELFTEERRQNMSKPRHKNWSDEARANMSLIQQKRFEDPNERAKCSRFGENNSMFGKKWDEEHLKLFSEMNKGKNNPFFGKTFTQEQLQKIKDGLANSEKFKAAQAARRGKKTGKRWFTNGVDDNIYAAECPVGYRPGRIMFGYTAWNKGMKKND